MVFDMATPDDAAFEKEFGSYRPTATSVPIRTIRPILGGESPEAAAARKEKEGREVSGEIRDEERLQLARKLLRLLPVRSLVLLKLKSAKPSLILSQNTKVTQT
jgi:hypothetical protein